MLKVQAVITKFSVGTENIKVTFAHVGEKGGMVKHTAVAPKTLRVTEHMNKVIDIEVDDAKTPWVLVKPAPTEREVSKADQAAMRLLGLLK